MESEGLGSLHFTKNSLLDCVKEAGDTGKFSLNFDKVLNKFYDAYVSVESPAAKSFYAGKVRGTFKIMREEEVSDNTLNWYYHIWKGIYLP